MKRSLSDRFVYRGRGGSAPNADPNLAGVQLILAALRRIDRARSELFLAEVNLNKIVNSADLPNFARREYTEFYRSGGCTGRQFREWFDDNYPRREVKSLNHLRLVSDLKMIRAPNDGLCAA